MSPCGRKVGRVVESQVRHAGLRLDIDDRSIRPRPNAECVAAEADADVLRLEEDLVAPGSAFPAGARRLVPPNGWRRLVGDVVERRGARPRRTQAPMGATRGPAGRGRLRGVLPSSAAGAAHPARRDRRTRRRRDLRDRLRRPAGRTEHGRRAAAASQHLPVAVGRPRAARPGQRRGARRAAPARPFGSANLATASTENERTSLHIRTPSGADVVAVQVAGLLARRIICDAHVGDKLSIGDTYGLIRFGSRLDTYFPAGSGPLVKSASARSPARPSSPS